MNTIIYSNKRLHRGRSSSLVVAKDNRIVAFGKLSINNSKPAIIVGTLVCELEGLMAILTHKYVQNGKWSGDTWSLALAEGVKAGVLVQGWETGTNYEALGSAGWKECHQALEKLLDCSIDFEHMYDFFHQDPFKAFAKAFDERDEALAAISKPAKAEVVELRFGAPTNREIKNGYWETSKDVKLSDGRYVRVTPMVDDWSKAVATVHGERSIPDPGPGIPWEPSWTEVDPEPLKGSAAKILNSLHSSGMHGGYWTFEIAVQTSNVR